MALIPEHDLTAFQGEVVTWAKLSAIECACGIEKTLDECMQRIDAHSATAAGAADPIVGPEVPPQPRRSGALRARIPSWLHIPAAAAGPHAEEAAKRLRDTFSQSVDGLEYCPSQEFISGEG